MKPTINPKHELANRIAKYLMSFDDNKEVNARMREELGKRLHKTEYDYTNYLKCLAKSGDVQSQYLLGLSYARGFGCVKNYCRAMKWWTKAAEQGNKSSQFLIGSSYYFDYEVYRNYKKAPNGLKKPQFKMTIGHNSCLVTAIIWAEALPKTTKQLLAGMRKQPTLATPMLGVCYYNGTGKPQSLHIDQSWFAKAAAKHHYVFH